MAAVKLEHQSQETNISATIYTLISESLKYTSTLPLTLKNVMMVVTLKLVYLYTRDR